MATEIKKVITIDTTGAVKALDELQKSGSATEQTFSSMKEYKQYIDKLTASLLDLEQGSEDYNKVIKEIKTSQDKMNSVMYDTKKSTDVAADSYEALSKQMSDLKKQWKTLAAGDERDKIGNDILSINEKLKEMDASLGNNQRNVGNYEQAFTSGIENMLGSLGPLAGGIGGVKTAVLGLGQALKALLANPIVLIIAAIVGGLKLLVDAFKRNEEATNKLKVAFSGFQLILTPIREGINWIVESFASLISYIPKIIAGIVKVGSFAVGLLNKIGIISDEKTKQIQESIDSATNSFVNANTKEQRGIKLETELLNKKRKQIVEEAKLKSQIEKLNSKIADEEKYNAKERAKFAEEAEKLQKKIYDGQVDIAKQELEIANLRVANGDRSTEALDAQAAAQAKLYELEEEYNAKQTTLISQRVQQNRDAAEKINEAKQKEIEAEKKAADEKEKIRQKEIDDEKKAADEKEKIRQKELEKVKEIEAEINAFRLTEGDKTKAQLTKKYQEDLSLLIKYGKDTKALRDKYLAEMATVDFEQGMDKLSKNDAEYSLLQEIADKTISNEIEKNKKLLELDQQRLAEKKRILEELLLIEDLSVEQRKEIFDELAKAEAESTENTKKEAQSQKEILMSKVNEYVNLANSLAGLMGSIAELWEYDIREREKNGKISEKQAEKEFEQVKSFQIATTIMTGLAGIASALSSPIANAMGPAGWIASALQAVTIATTTALQVSKIKAMKYDSSASSSSTMPSSNVTTYTPNYSNSVTGKSEEENLQNAVENGTRNGAKDIRVYVLESDIREAGKKTDVREYETTF